MTSHTTEPRPQTTLLRSGDDAVVVGPRRPAVIDGTVHLAASNRGTARSTGAVSLVTAVPYDIGGRRLPAGSDMAAPSAYALEPRQRGILRLELSDDARTLLGCGRVLAHAVALGEDGSLRYSALALGTSA